MRKIFVVAVSVVMAVSLGLGEADAASRKKRKRWADYNRTERAELMKLARAVCRKKYGAIATVYRIDYSREKIWCTMA